MSDNVVVYNLEDGGAVVNATDEDSIYYDSSSKTSSSSSSTSSTPATGTNAPATSLTEGDVRSWIHQELAQFTGDIRVGSLISGQVFVLDASGLRMGATNFSSAPFSVDYNGNLIASSATVTGSITATSGAIGGFTIGADYVRDVANSFGLASTVSAGDDVRFWAGSTFASRATAPFRVTEAGVVTAISGTIGGWTLASTTLTGGSTVLDSTGVVTVGTSNDVAILSSADATYRVWVGNAAGASAPFSVTKAGVLYAVSGTVGGWTLSTTSFTGGDTVLSSTGVVTVGTSNNVAILSSADATYRLWIGNATAASATFSVTKAGAIFATSGTIGGWTLAATTLTSAGGGIVLDDGNNRISVGTGSPNIMIDGVAITIGTSTFASGQAGWRIDGDGSAEFNNIVARGEFRTAVFVKDEIHATGGSLLVLSASTLYANATTVTTPTTSTIDITDPPSGHAQLFSVNDILRIKDGTGLDNWLKVTAVSDQTTFYRYTVDKQSGTNGTFYAGTAVVNYKQSTDGFVLLTSDLSNAPYIDIGTNGSTPWSGTTAKARLGKLSGITDPTFGTLSGYGLWTDSGYFSGSVWASAGKFGTSTNYWSISSGVLVATGSGDVAIRAGQTDYDTGTGFWLGLKTGTAKLSLGNSAGDKLTWDGSALTLVGTITATSGSIGGWTLTTGYFYSLTSGTPTASPNNGIVMRSGSTAAMIVYEGTAKRVEVGYLASSVFGIKCYATDGTTVVFEISDTQQKIAGFTFTDSTITATNLSITSGAANVANITVGTGSTSAGLNSANTGTDIAFWAGSTFANRATAPFRVNAQGDVTATSVTISGGVTTEVSVTSGEGITAGDHVGFTSADTVKRFAPTALATTWDSTGSIATGGNDLYATTIQTGAWVRLSSSLYATLHYENNGGALSIALTRVPITATTGVVGTMTQSDGLTGITGSGADTFDMIGAGTNKALLVASSSNSIRALVVDLTTTITEGTQVSVDTTNCLYGFGDYISDSHVLVFYQDTSANTIVFSKYTLSGTTLTASSTGNVDTSLSGSTYYLKGVRRFLGTDLFLIVVQDDTAGSAKAAVATYTQASSTFTAVSSYVSFPSSVDISSMEGMNALFAQLSATEMLITFPSSTTNVSTVLVTISGTTPSFSTVLTRTRGTNSGYSLTKVNARCALQTSLSTTTITHELIEISSGGAAITSRVSEAATTLPDGGDIYSNGIAFAWQVNPKRMCLMGMKNTNADMVAGTGKYTLPPSVGIAKTTVASSATLVVSTGGPDTHVSGLTASSRYYADIGGLLTTDDNETPDKVGVTKDTDEIILKSW